MRDRRQVPRYLVGRIAKFSQLASGAVSPVTVTTISVHGCSIEGSPLANVGEKGALSIEWQGAHFQGEAEVISKPDKGRTGLKFVSLKPDSLEFLRKLCASLRLQPLEPLPPEPEDEHDPSRER